MVRGFVPGKQGTCSVACVGAPLAMPQGLSKLQPQGEGTALLFPLYFYWASCPYPDFCPVSAFTSLPAAVPFHKSLLDSVLEAWQHLLYVGQPEHPQTLFSSMNVFESTENVPSLESTSATNEWVLRVLLGQEPCVFMLFLYFSTSCTFGPCETWVIGLNKHLVYSSTTDPILKRRQLLQRELSHRPQFQKFAWLFLC